MKPLVWKTRLEDLENRHLARRMRTMDGPVATVMATDSGNKINFCSNDYLGLANDPRIKSAMVRNVEQWGTGTGSSRLVSGNTRIHDEAEKALAKYMNTECAIVFPSGYQANVGALVSLTQPGDAIFSDALVHASIVDGCRLSRADVHVYKHSDVDHLDELLEANRNSKLKLIVTDAVFSMDGDAAPLEKIVSVAKRHDAFVYVDEAHALGVIGTKGRGLSEKLGLTGDVAIRIGTFGKAFGTAGAFVATDKYADGLIRSKARSLLYTTASPAPLVGATTEALEIVKNADLLRARLQENISHFKELARASKLPLLESDSAIQPVMVGCADLVMEASSKLWNRGLFVQGMRPPTVRQGTSRLRVTLTAAHTKHQVQKLVQGLFEVLVKMDKAR